MWNVRIYNKDKKVQLTKHVQLRSDLNQDVNQDYNDKIMNNKNGLLLLLKVYYLSNISSS